jgi:spore maturation protein CgeB
MRILLATCRNPHFPTLTEYAERALLAEGCFVDFFDDRAFLLPGRLRDRWPALQDLELKRINRGLVRRALAARPDLVLAMGGTRVSASALEALRRASLRTALWTIDRMREADAEHFSRTAPLYGRVFCGGTEALDLLAARGFRAGRWLPFGFDSFTHAPAEPLPELSGLGLCFIGSHYPNRERTFESIADLKPRVWGPGWEKLRKGSPLAGLVEPGQIPPDFWMRAYASAKIVLCVHDAPDSTPCHQASPRVYEALATGSFLLCDAQRDVAALFRDGEHLALYRNSGELREKALHFLERPEERARIAAQGRRAVLEAHSYSHRMKALLAEALAP